MARSAKRITRKDLRQPDQFVTFTGKLIQLLKDHKTAGVATATGLVLAALLFVGWDYYKTRQNRQAEKAYSAALVLYRDQNYRAAIDVLQRVSKYRLSSYSRLALLYEANSYLALQEAQKAVLPLEALLRKETKDGYLRQLALMTLASTYEKTGKFQQSSSTYEKAEKTSGPFKEEALLGRARVSVQNQNYKEGLTLYRSYLASYPMTEKNGEVQLRIQELEVKVGADEKTK